MALVLSGCGAQYRPVVSAINPVGPAPQPTKYAIALSNPSTSPTTLIPGLLTFVDVSGDTVLSTPSVLPFPGPTSPGDGINVAPTPTFVNPLNFSLTLTGSEGFLVNSTGTFEDFFTSNPETLPTTDPIFPQQLAAGVVPNGIQAYSLPSSGSTLFIPNGAQISELAASSGGGTSLLQNLTGLGLTNPMYIVGTDNASRVYAIDPGTGTTNGNAYPIENAPVSLLAPIAVDVDPVYGVMTADANRAFILNKGSGTVTVINVPSNAKDVTTPTITLPTTVGTITGAPNPVWAEFATINSELVVLNQGDGVHAGSVSIINIPLCNANTPVINPNCNPANPVDANGFGTIVGTVSVGISPTMVSVLNDGTRVYAYVVNGSDPKCPSSLNNGTFEGSVSVVNLNQIQLTTTICGTSVPSATLTPSGTGSSPALIYGHPNTIAATTGTPTGKVYVTSSDNKYMTVIETDTNTVDTHISLQGLGIRVLVNVK